jgi:hypothetical protein
MLESILADPSKLLAAVVLVMVLFEWMVAYFLYQNTKNFLKHSRTATATIVRFEPGKKTALRLFVSYKNYLGSGVETLSKIYAPNGKYKVGDTLEVLYSTKEESDVRPNSPKNLLLLPKLMFFSSIPMLLFAAWAMYSGVLGSAL